MNIGYARVSTVEQKLDLQIRALEEAGCRAIFTDKASGVDGNRRGLAKALRRCGAGDVLIVWKLDRLGRSLFELVEMIERLNARGAGLRVLTGQGAMIDTTRPEGRMIFGIFAVLAEFERELIRERTKAGMEAARLRGARIGRPCKLTSDQVEDARHHLAGKEMSLSAVAAYLGVDVTTLRRSLKRSR